MENFDAVSAWRSHEVRSPIDASGQLLDGTKVNGIAELRKALLKQTEKFVGTVTDKLMLYNVTSPQPVGSCTPKEDGGVLYMETNALAFG
jgi:hypothetical protein